VAGSSGSWSGWRGRCQSAMPEVLCTRPCARLLVCAHMVTLLMPGDARSIAALGRAPLALTALLEEKVSSWLAAAVCGTCRLLILSQAARLRQAPSARTSPLTAWTSAARSSGSGGRSARRSLREGTVAAGDQLSVIHRPRHGMIARARCCSTQVDLPDCRSLDFPGAVHVEQALACLGLDRFR